MTFLAIGALVVAWLAAILVLTTVASRRLGFDVADEIVAVICGSQKSLASGAPIANVLFGKARPSARSCCPRCSTIPSS